MKPIIKAETTAYNNIYINKETSIVQVTYKCIYICYI